LPPIDGLGYYVVGGTS